jgi:D,D-heptose 1,7-bisphosphate phosphatase
MIEQAVILCGGFGTRLGSLTTKVPKPLLPVGDAPFLQALIQEVARCGIRDFLLLAGHMSEQMIDFAHTVSDALGLSIHVEVAIERHPAGTGGALFEARDRLADTFLLLNGDSFFDFRMHELSKLLSTRTDALGAVALRYVEDSGRYGSVRLAGDEIVRFEEKDPTASAGLVNGGVYLFRRNVLDYVTDNCSLERDVMPAIAADGLLLGRVGDGFFVDIGLPETYEEAQHALIAHRQRPAVFLDRDGVLNRDTGHVGTVERFVWTVGAREAIRLINDRGYYAFVVTNQAGIAKGKYTLDDYWALRAHIREDLFVAGAQIDDERFCPYHPDAFLDAYRISSDWRKPGSGMLLDLMKYWPIETNGTFLVGDQASDIAAAEAAGVRGYRFEGGNLRDFIEICLNAVRD